MIFLLLFVSAINVIIDLYQVNFDSVLEQSGMIVADKPVPSISAVAIENGDYYLVAQGLIRKQ